MMKNLAQKEAELGTVTALLRRASRRRIPRLLRIKKAVDDGARLNAFQVTFLGRVFRDAQQLLPYIDHHPEYQDIITRMVSLYHDIMDQAIVNERARLNSKAPRIDLPPHQDGGA